MNPGDRQQVLQRLLLATARGDRTAFARLYRLTSAHLYAVALRMLKDEAAAQDCLQETWLAVWRHAAAYDGERAAVTTWLQVILRRRALDMLRRRRPDTGTLDPDALPFPTPADAVDTMALETCLDELEAEQRRCIRLAYLEGLTHAELARRLGQPLGTVKSRIRRGLERLRQCLQ